MDTIEKQNQTQSPQVAGHDFSKIIGDVIEFKPEELKIDAELNVRPTVSSKKDREKTERLAETIREVGQLQDAGAYPVLNAETGAVDFYLFMGNRRRQAVSLLNQNGGSYNLRVRIFAPEEAKDLKRKALIENIHRDNYSPIALSHQIKAIREENGWATAKNWSALVADYLKVSRAQVTQHMRLLDELGPDQIKRIDEEGWSAVAAFELLDTRPEKREEVAAKATEEARKEQEEKSKKKAKDEKAGKEEKSGKDGKDGKPVTKQSSTPSPSPSPAPDPDPEPTVKAKHVRKAARDAEALNVHKPLAKSEIVEFFRKISETTEYGFINSPVRQFAIYFTAKFVPGLGKEKTLMEKFDAMIMDKGGEIYSGVGTPSKAELQEQAAEEERAAEKAKGKKKSK